MLVILGLFALYGVLFFMTLYLQRVHGYSPVQAGVRLLPLTATFSISSPLGGVLTARFGPRVPLFIGMVLMGAAFLGLRSIGIHTSYNGQWPWFVAVGIALGLIIVASTQAIVGNAPVDKAGRRRRHPADGLPARRRDRHLGARHDHRRRRQRALRRPPGRARRARQRRRAS